MKQFRPIWIIIYTITALILGWSIFFLIGAVNYQPAAPKKGVLHQYDFETEATGLVLSRYQELLEGGLFFEKPPAPPVT